MMGTFTVIMGQIDRKLTVIGVLEGDVSLSQTPHYTDDVEIFTRTVEAETQEIAERDALALYTPQAENLGAAERTEPPC